MSPLPLFPASSPPNNGLKPLPLSPDLTSERRSSSFCRINADDIPVTRKRKRAPTFVNSFASEVHVLDSHLLSGERGEGRPIFWVSFVGWHIVVSRATPERLGCCLSVSLKREPRLVSLAAFGQSPGSRLVCVCVRGKVQ